MNVHDDPLRPKITPGEAQVMINRYEQLLKTDGWGEFRNWCHKKESDCLNEAIENLDAEVREKNRLVVLGTRTLFRDFFEHIESLRKTADKPPEASDKELMQ